jgi:branched-chain amino acid aminotransferase
MDPRLAISIDGEVVDPAAATISVLDRGLLHGDGVFEIVRTVGPAPVELPAHLGRLTVAAGALALRIWPPAALAGAIDRTIAAAPAGDLRLRVVVTRGAGPISARLAALGPGRTIVIAEPLAPPPASVTVTVVDWPLPRRPGAGAKTLAYLDHLRARELAAEVGADEALRLDADGAVAEGSLSSLFIVAGGEVVTPPATGGILPGVTRARVLALCGQRAIPAAERTITLAALHAADELFVTSAGRGVVPVVAVDGAPRAAGPVSLALREAHQDFLRTEAATRR